jgi:hypothetical protein
VVAAELVAAGNINDHMPMVTKVGVLDDQITATCLAVGLAHRWYVVALCRMTDRLQRIQDCLVGILRAASVLVAGVDAITVPVDDVPIARADERQRRPVAVVAWPVSILTACELSGMSRRLISPSSAREMTSITCAPGPRQDFG